MSSAEPGIQMIRARGAAFFTLPFPEPGQPLDRRFDTPGRVVLTNGAGYYWQSADLFVSDHPYWTVTDAQGRFTLPQVPPVNTPWLIGSGTGRSPAPTATRKPA